MPGEPSRLTAHAAKATVAALGRLAGGPAAQRLCSPKRLVAVLLGTPCAALDTLTSHFHQDT